LHREYGDLFRVRPGSGRSSNPLITLKTVVFTAIPSPSVTLAMIVKPGELRRVLAA
jgi:hypothetical protein